MYDYEWDRLKTWLAQYGALDDSITSVEDITRLDLSAKSLKVLPDSIGVLTHLLVLNLANNELSTLPETMKNLKSLKNLDIRRNNFDVLPDIIGLLPISSFNASGNQLKDATALQKCKELRVLDLSVNVLSKLESFLSADNELRTLNLSSNLIRSIVPFSYLLSSLERFDISNNVLTEIPEEIKNLVSLEELNISSNSIKTIDSSFFDLEVEIVDLSANSLKNLNLHALDSLEELTLDENDFAEIKLEDSFAPYLRKFSCDSCSLQEFLLPSSHFLEYISYASNKISAIPDEISKYDKLNYLDIEGNSVESLPDSLANLVYLQTFYAQGNPLKEGTKKILEVLSPTICDLNMKFGIVLEKAKEEDFAEMARLLGVLFAIEKDFKIDYEKQLSGIQKLHETDGTDLLVAKHEGKVVGMVTMQRLVSSAEGDHIGQIEDLVVDETYRKMGVGSRLVNKIRVIAQEYDYKRIQLAADMDNENALAFYNRRGFNKTNLNMYHYIT